MAKARRASKRKSMTLPIAVLAGLMPTAYESWNASKSMGLTGVAYTVVSNLTGYSLGDNKWYMNSLVRGWTPILIGFGLHKIASKLGINRALQSAGVPLIRI